MPNRKKQPALASPHTEAVSARLSVSRLYEENLAAYNTAHGRESLRVIELSFEERWIYLFELIQNAIDAGARRIAVSTNNGQLLFQHDGPSPLTERSVRGLSSLFASTKGLDTVGF